MIQPTQQSGCASARYLQLGHASRDELEAILQRGTTPDLASIAGWEYRGRNVAWWAERSPILKFRKGFYRDAAGATWGYNIPMVQNALEEPWIAKPAEDDPKRFGFFRVERVDPAAKDNLYLQAVLLDYGRGENPLIDPSKVLRDYLVRVDPGSDDLLLGKAYAAIGPLRKRLNFFLLERHRQTSWVRR